VADFSPLCRAMFDLIFRFEAMTTGFGGRLVFAHIRFDAYLNRV
jgi:hypothetical protein